MPEGGLCPLLALACFHEAVRLLKQGVASTQELWEGVCQAGSQSLQASLSLAREGGKRKRVLTGLEKGCQYGL